MPCSTTKPNTKGEDHREKIACSHTWCQSQPISSALTGSINHRGRLMVSACPPRLFVVLPQAKWYGDWLFCSLWWPHIPSVFTSSPPMSAASTSHYPHIWLIHSPLQVCAPHLSFCLAVKPSWCFHHNSLKTEITCYCYDSRELSLYTSTKASSCKHENLNHAPMFYYYSTYTFWIWCAVPNRLNNIYNNLVVLNSATNLQGWCN